MSELVIETVVVPQRKAAVIDDAFDDVVEGEIPLESFNEFLLATNQNGELEKVLTKLNITVPETNEWEDDTPELYGILQELWKNREDPDLLPLINHPALFSVKLAKLAELKLVCKNLSEQNIDVKAFKSTITDLEIFQSGEFVYIFLDYRLGVKNDDEAIKNAKKVVKDIYDKCPKGKKPVTILMSSEPHVDELKDQFREAAGGLVEGAFRFSPKTDLKDINKVSLLARAYQEEFLSNHALQEYIQSLIVAAQQAHKTFSKEVKTLTIEDYEYMQNSVLKEQQQPLGDYLAWLYGTHWTNLLLKNVDLKNRQSDIDKLISEKAPLHHHLPSEKLSDMFMTALFEDEMDEIKYHPWEGQEANVAKLPYLHLGDILTKIGQSEVYMVLNPQCDLERPKLASSKQSIFLLPGSIDSLSNLVKPTAVRTDYFKFDDSQYRIYWELKQVFTITLDSFEQWLADIGYERKFRLRLPFALEIQQRFTSNMSRVGLPVAPPISRKVYLEIFYNQPNGETVDFIKKNEAYAFHPLTRNDKEKIRLTLNFALDFKALLIERLVHLQGWKEQNKDQLPPNFGKHLQKLETIINEFDDWFFDTRELTYPRSEKFDIVKKDCISVTLDCLDATKSPTPILINIVTKEKSVPTAVQIETEMIKDGVVEDQEEHQTTIAMGGVTAAKTEKVEAPVKNENSKHGE